MKLSIKGTQTNNGQIIPLVWFLESVEGNKLWDYMGLRVELDPTVDYNSQNILIRWLDVDEGFNDKLIVNDINEFYSLFSLIEND